MAIVIELVGTPCSGKTTIFKTMTNEAASNVIDAEVVLKYHYIQKTRLVPFSAVSNVMTVLKVLILLFSHLINLPIHLKFYSLCAYQILACNGRGKAFRSFFFKVGKYFILKDISETKKVIVDEGIIQMLFSLFVREKSLDEKTIGRLSTIIECMPLPDEVIIVPNRSVDVLVSTILARGHHRVTGYRHSRGITPEGLVVDSAMKRKAEIFINTSIELQNILVPQLEQKTLVTNFVKIE